MDESGSAAGQRRTLKAQLEFQARIKRCHQLNPEMTLTAMSERFGVSATKIRWYLTCGTPYPPGYRKIQKLTGRSIEAVAQAIDDGKVWCVQCREFLPGIEFYLTGNLSKRHYAYQCVRGKRGKDGKKKMDKSSA